MHVGVLANLECGEVEAERFDLPGKVLDLAPRDAVRAVGLQRLRDHAEVCQQLIG